MLLACLALSFVGSRPRNLNYNGTRPILFNSIFLNYLIYRYRVYLVFTHSLHTRSSPPSFILACTNVVRKVCSCVHTYTKAAYDVHAVFSVHVCNSLIYRIICSLLYDCLFPLFIFKFFFLVYANCIHNRVYYISLEFHWNITFWHMLPGHFTKYTSGIYCILWKLQHITGLISCGWYSEVYSSHCISLLYNCTLTSTHFTAFILVHRVHIVLTFSHGFYVYEMYTSGFIFSRLSIRPSHIYAFSNITFSYCPSRLRMLASG